MSLFRSDADRRFAESIRDLIYSNPFNPERLEIERRALGNDILARVPVWSFRRDVVHRRDEVYRQLLERAERTLKDVTQGTRGANQLEDNEKHAHEAVVHFVLYFRFRKEFGDLLTQSNDRAVTDLYTRFSAAAKEYRFFKSSTEARRNLSHLFASLFQIRRAFEMIFRYIVGGSSAAAQLRVRVWESIFTHDMKRYFDLLSESMHEFPTLVTGASGTGKELVARAIAKSQYIPFDTKTKTFAGDVSHALKAVNLSALAPTLIESELFGHVQGAFTDARRDRVGWLEGCRRWEVVFLDELAELDQSLQVKLLRVLQSRVFQRLGDTSDRSFAGKLVAATNRELSGEMASGRFREDLYYRICADRIRTPSLREQLDDKPDELQELITYLCSNTLDDDGAATKLAADVTLWIEEHLAADYDWPGNMRELEQCVRSILIHHRYDPPRRPPLASAEMLGRKVSATNMTWNELASEYCALVFSKTGNYQETARRLALDHRTVKRYLQSSQTKVNPDKIDTFSSGG